MRWWWSVTRSRFARWARPRSGSWSARDRRYSSATILEVVLPDGGQTTLSVPQGYQGFAYMPEGEAALGANGLRAKVRQLVLLGPGDDLTVTDAAPGTRFMLMAGSRTVRRRASTARTWIRGGTVAND
jgi:redox-sensitive bicupin YhaK (pirin superfamily)